MTMEQHKISKLLNDSNVLKLVTRKWVEVNDLLGSKILGQQEYKM